MLSTMRQDSYQCGKVSADQIDTLSTVKCPTQRVASALRTRFAMMPAELSRVCSETLACHCSTSATRRLHQQQFLRLKLPSGRLAGLVLSFCHHVEQNGEEAERESPSGACSLYQTLPLTSELFRALQYDKRLSSFLDKYDRAFIVAADNVGSKQFQDIRRVSIYLCTPTCILQLQLPPILQISLELMVGTIIQGLREHSVVLMGKNTLMKRCIRQYADRTQDDKWNVLLDYLVVNVGIIFTSVSLQQTRFAPLFPLQCWGLSNPSA